MYRIRKRMLALALAVSLASIGASAGAEETSSVGRLDKDGQHLAELRRESAKNLAKFGLVLAAYATDHDGSYPDTLESFFDSLRKGASTYGLSEELARWADYNVRYFGKGKTIEDSDETAIAYGNRLFEAPASQGTNVLFANGQVRFIKKDQLERLNGLPEAILEILDIKIDPIRQGKNVVRVKVQNNTEQDQVSRIQIYTLSPGVSGWGTSFLDVIKAGETKWIRHGCKIAGPITEGTYIRLDFHNPGPAANVNIETRQYGDRRDWFKSVRYESRDLEHHKVDESQVKPASKAEAQAVIKTLRQIQDYIEKKQYTSAWGLFTQDFKEAEFMYRYRALERFKEKMERPVRYSLSGMELLALQPQSVRRVNDVLVLAAAMKDRVWTVDFVQANGQYKLDSIGGVIPNDWQERLLPMLEKRATKHFDIYYFKDSTAEKEIDSIAEEKERGFDQICSFLGKDSDERIRMVFFEDGETKRYATGHQGAGWAFGNTIVEVYCAEQKLDPYHETVHILMRPYGNPPALFNEGFATYMAERLGAKALKNMDGGQSSIYERVRELKSKGEWIELKELIGYTNIGPRWSRPPVSYPEAASVVEFLIEEYGNDKFLRAYKELKNSDDTGVKQQNIKTLERIYGKSLTELEIQWQAAFSKK